MGNIITRKLKQRAEHKELLDHIEKLNTENNAKNDELMKLKMEYKIQNDKLLAYMHDALMIENALQNALSFIHIPSE
tara:strand:- start:364 stop:594 length:231 start_codon:yes stop_codon:yes gene_type:complete